MSVEKKEKINISQGPIWYKMLCLAAATYSILYILIFVTGIINLSLLNKVFSIYTDTPPDPNYILLFVTLNLILSLFMFYGVIKLFKSRKVGYFFFEFSALLMIATKLLFNNRNFFEIGLITLFILLFTIRVKKYN